MTAWRRSKRFPLPIEPRLSRRSGRRTISAQAGVSLLEIMVVLVIIGMVAAVAAPQLLSYLDRAKIDTAKVELRSLRSIMDLYRLDVGRYPTADEGLAALTSAPPGLESWRGPYLDDTGALIDPWDNPYAYEVSSDGRSAKIVSFGADGAAGGSGLDADISK